MGTLYCENVSNRLQEAWGDFVDTSEWRRDTPSFMPAGSPYGPLPSNITDRYDGRYMPFYQTEADLALMRGESRAVAKFSSISVGAVEALERYIFGRGFEITPKPKKSVNADPVLMGALLGEVKSVIDEFCEQNRFNVGPNAFECEMHSRLREDGEVLVELESRLGPNGRPMGLSGIGVKARFNEPDSLTEPADKFSLERWLGILDLPETSWSFGVHTSRRDTDEAFGYHFVYTSAGDDWDYVPAIVGHPANPRKTLVMGKRNVPRNAKRGIADFMPIAGDLSREAKLANNMAVGAALQAAIVWVEERVANAPLPATAGGSTYSPQTSTSVGQIGFPTLNGADKQLTLNKFPAGSIPKVTAGFQFKGGPMGAERNGGFIEVAQYVLRRIGVRWNCPEYMISGDASNSNFASTLVAESPFVKARESDQESIAGIHRETIWKVIEFYEQAGRFRSLVPNFAQLKQLIEVQVQPPEVATRDPMVLTQLLALQKQNGWVNDRTAQSKLGLDPDTDGPAPTPGSSGNPASGEPQNGAATAVAGGEFVGMNLRAVKNIDKLRKQYLDDFRNGTATEQETRLALDGLGYSADKIDKYLDSDPTNDPADDPVDEVPATANQPEGDSPAMQQLKESISRLESRLTQSQDHSDLTTPSAVEMMREWENYP